MNYSFSEEQIQLRDTVTRFLEQYSPTSEIRRLMDLDSGYDPNVWKALLTNVGLGGICVTEDHGGAGLRFVDQAIVLEEMGRHLFCSPYLSSNVFGVTCIDGFGTGEQKSSLLPSLISGENNNSPEFDTERHQEIRYRWIECGPVDRSSSGCQ